MGDRLALIGDYDRGMAHPCATCSLCCVESKVAGARTALHLEEVVKSATSHSFEAWVRQPLEVGEEWLHERSRPEVLQN